MTQIHDSVAAFLDTLTHGLDELFAEAEPGHPPVTWAPRPAESTRSDFLWWSCELSVDPACRLFRGRSPNKPGGSSDERKIRRRISSRRWRG